MSSSEIERLQGVGREAEGSKRKIVEYEQRVKRLTEEFERLNSIIQELRKENTIYKQNIYNLETQIQQFASLDEKNRFLNEEIDRLAKILNERDEEISELRVRFSDEAALTKRINEHLSLFVVLFAEIESLRKRVKE